MWHDEIFVLQDKSEREIFSKNVMAVILSLHCSMIIQGLQRAVSVAIGQEAGIQIRSERQVTS